MADHPTSCSACYEDFTTAQENDRLVGRQLSCGHAACTACLEELLDDGEICCPECFEMTATGLVAELPALTPAVAEPEPEPAPAPAPAPAGGGGGALAAFMSTTRSAAPSPAASGGGSKLSSFMSSNPSAAPAAAAAAADDGDAREAGAAVPSYVRERTLTTTISGAEYEQLERQLEGAADALEGASFSEGRLQLAGPGDAESDRFAP